MTVAKYHQLIQTVKIAFAVGSRNQSYFKYLSLTTKNNPNIPTQKASRYSLFSLFDRRGKIFCFFCCKINSIGRSTIPLVGFIFRLAILLCFLQNLICLNKNIIDKKNIMHKENLSFISETIDIVLLWSYTVTTYAISQ